MTRRRSLILMAAMIALAVVSVVATIVILRPTSGGTGPDSLTSAHTSRSPSPTRTTPTPTPTSTPAAAPPAEPAPEEPAAPTCADDVLTCVNQARVANGLGELTANGTLDAAAQACADRMAAAGQMTHSTDHPGGFSAWGENIAYGYPTAADVFNGWMGSDGHRANILNPAYTQMGIGYVAAGSWWCQQFGG